MITQVGLMRKLVGRMRNLRHGDNYQGGDGWSMDIEAAAAEAVVAKYLNLYWNPGGMNAPADVGDKVQVRWSHRPDARLIVHVKDHTDQPFVLVTGQLPHFTLVGWMVGRDAQQECYWVDPGTGRPAFFVPQSDLRVMPLLRTMIAEMIVTEARQDYAGMIE